MSSQSSPTPEEQTTERPVTDAPSPRAKALREEMLGNALSLDEVAYILSLDRTTVAKYLREGTLAVEATCFFGRRSFVGWILRGGRRGGRDGAHEGRVLCGSLRIVRLRLAARQTHKKRGCVCCRAKNILELDLHLVSLRGCGFSAIPLANDHP